VNWIAIIVATIVNIGLGSAWFSQSAFGKKWMEWEGHTGMGGGRPVGVLVGITAFGALLSSYTLSWLLIQTGTNTLVGGALLGLSVGIGLVVPAMLADHLFNSRKDPLFLIVAGYPVVGLFLVGAILGAIR
jgi:uncharacterized protein DUF1761